MRWGSGHPRNVGVGDGHPRNLLGGQWPVEDVGVFLCGGDRHIEETAEVTHVGVVGTAAETLDGTMAIGDGLH